jgi:hypothetical protein
MAEVVHVQVGNSDLLAALPPRNSVVEVPPPMRLAVLIAEDQRVRRPAWVGGEVVLELGEDADREGNDPGPRT